MKAVSIPIVSWLVSVTNGQVGGKGSPFPSPSQTYELWEAQKVHNTLALWKIQYPDLVRITTSQERYGLSRAGKGDDCSFEVDAAGCSNAFFTIQDFVAHPENQESSQLLPEIFWNGVIHGDERLGATVVMEAASLLLDAAECEAKPRKADAETWVKELALARTCRNQLYERGIDDERRKWLARLVSTRRIVVVPTANSLGFDRNDRTEESVDPDQDFPYEYLGTRNSSSCMETIAARTINDIFREHMFQLVLSFHSGAADRIDFSWGPDQWGDYSYSPDLKAQMKLAEACKNGLGAPIAGLQTGWMNNLTGTQYRKGSFEDWAYASSWDSERLRTCTPTTTGEYSAERISYNNSTNRAIALAVSSKMSNVDLGTSAALFEEDGQNSPLIRSIRMAFALADLVQPYLTIVNVGTTILSDDVVPLTGRGGRRCQATKAISVPTSMDDRLLVEWTVGGGFQFSEVELWYARSKEISESEVDCLSQPSIDVRNDPRFIKGYFVQDESVTHGNGTGAFSKFGPQPFPSGSRPGAGRLMGPVFRATIDLSGFDEGEQLMLIAGARADQDLARPPSAYTYDPRVGPQSHLINARTNPNWDHEIENGKRIRGRLDWYSTPVTVLLANYESRIGTMQLNDRFRRDINTDSSSLRQKSQNSKALSAEKKGGRLGKALGVFFMTVIIIACFVAYRRYHWLQQAEKCKAMYFIRRPPCGIDGDNIENANNYSVENQCDDQEIGIHARETIEFEDFQEQSDKSSLYGSGLIFDFEYAQHAELFLEEIHDQAKCPPKVLADPRVGNRDDTRHECIMTESRDDRDDACKSRRRLGPDDEVIDFVDSQPCTERSRGVPIFDSDCHEDNILNLDENSNGDDNRQSLT